MILIGGYTVKNGLGQITNYLYELSGDSEENLTWSLLEQKLDVGRYFHWSLPIPNQLIPSQFVKQEWNIYTIIKLQLIIWVFKKISWKVKICTQSKTKHDLGNYFKINV